MCNLPRSRLQRVQRKRLESCPCKALLRICKLLAARSFLFLSFFSFFSLMSVLTRQHRKNNTYTRKVESNSVVVGKDRHSSSNFCIHISRELRDWAREPYNSARSSQDYGITSGIIKTLLWKLVTCTPTRVHLQRPRISFLFVRPEIFSSMQYLYTELKNQGLIKRVGIIPRDYSFFFLIHLYDLVKEQELIYFYVHLHSGHEIR